jgi:deazaflavin-dependent oxidoreductase (nitroreductase family)
MSDFMTIGNFFIQSILTSPLHGMLSKSTLVVEFTGRKSGQKLSTPVNYTQEDNLVRITSQKDRQWWRNLKSHPEVLLWLRGKQVHGIAEVFDSPSEVLTRLADYLRPAPKMARYFHVEVLSDGSFDADDLMEAAQNMVVIEIKLDEPSRES